MTVINAIHIFNRFTALIYIYNLFILSVFSTIVRFCRIQCHITWIVTRLEFQQPKKRFPHIKSVSALKRLVRSVQWALIGSSLRVCCGAQVPDVISVLKDSVIPLTPVTHRHYPTRRRNSRSFKRTLWDLTEHFKCTHSPQSNLPLPEMNAAILYYTVLSTAVSSGHIDSFSPF